MHEAMEIGWVALPVDEKSTLPLNPGKESLDEPSTLESARPSAGRGLALSTGAMRRIISVRPSVISSSSPVLSYARLRISYPGLASIVPKLEVRRTGVTLCRNAKSLRADGTALTQ